MEKIITQGMVLDAFVDEMMAAVNRDDENEREQLRSQLEERTEKAVLGALPDAKLIELEGMLDREATDEEVESFLENAGVDYTAAMEKAMTDFREEYFNNVNSMGGQN